MVAPLSRRHALHPLLNALLPVAMLALLTACGQQPPQLAPLAPDAVIVAFGDSLTYGTGAARRYSYPAELARLTGRKVVNAGVPGELSGAGAGRLPAVLARYHPDLLVLCHGGNDLLRHHSPDTLAANLAVMLDTAHHQKVPVILLGVPQPALFGLHAAPVYERLAERFHVPYYGRILAKLESHSQWKSDRVHPNARGYRLLADAVYRLLKRSGAL
ncbi:MAG: arylesterase [Gammaproteobacteria bacterium]